MNKPFKHGALTDTVAYNRLLNEAITNEQTIIGKLPLEIEELKHEIKSKLNVTEVSRHLSRIERGFGS
jgi:DNA polymerase III epsilon subunit-like protein